MSSFVGDYICKLDEKGRVLVPAAFRRQSRGAFDRLILKKDVFEDCLVVYTIEEWEQQVEFLKRKLNPYNKKHSQFLREFYKMSAEVELDSNGRILIPKRFVGLVGLQKEVVFVGVGDKIEIWDKEKYDNTDMTQEEFAADAEQLLGDLME
jgi:mraZ protein